VVNLDQSLRFRGTAVAKIVGVGWLSRNLDHPLNFYVGVRNTYASESATFRIFL
jgi:hypothetical protein